MLKNMTAVLIALCLTLTNLSTGFAQASPRSDGPDVIAISAATSTAGDILPAGFWISQSGLAILVSEVSALEQENKVLSRQVNLYKVLKCPEPVEDATPYSLGDIFSSGAIGATTGAGLTLITIAIINAR